MKFSHKSNSQAYDILGFIVAILGGIAIFLLVIKASSAVVVKKDGEQALSINLSAFSSPKPLPVSKRLTKPKKKVVKKIVKKKKKVVKAKPKPKPQKLVAVPELPKEEIEEVKEEVQKPVEDMPNAIEDEIASSPPPSPNANAEKTIQTLKAQAGETNELLNEIGKQIYKYNRYPRMAQLRGYEGVVSIRFFLDIDGSVTKIELVQESGHKILDKAALKAVKKASPKFPKPDQQYFIEIPIEYSIDDA